MGRPELLTDPRFKGHAERGHHMEELDTIIAEWTSTCKADALLESLHEKGVPAGRIFRAKDMFTDPHFAAREAIVRLTHQRLVSSPCTMYSHGSPRRPERFVTWGRHWARTTKKSTRACWHGRCEDRVAPLSWRHLGEEEL